MELLNALFLKKNKNYSSVVNPDQPQFRGEVGFSLVREVASSCICQADILLAA